MIKRTMKTVLLGSNGLLGGAIAAQGAHEFIAPRHAELELLDHQAVQRFLAQERPDVLINCTAYSQVDQAEDEPVVADALNHLAVKNLAAACDAVQTSLVHFSTDFVFDGTKGAAYVETDMPNPLGVYGASKLTGEQAVLASLGAHFAFRVSWLYGAAGKNFFSGVRNWLQEGRHLPIVSDQTSTPNDVRNLARVLNAWLSLAKNHPTGCKAFFQQHQGLYHFSAPDVMSRYEFAQRVAEDLKSKGIQVKATMEPVPASRFPMKAKRPAHSGLNSAKFQTAFGISF
jgi:dTDP-4-dehydrorhamnose reductase